VSECEEWLYNNKFLLAITIITISKGQGLAVCGVVQCGVVWCSALTCSDAQLYFRHNSILLLYCIVLCWRE
jgi:hypothetical protein